MEKASKLQHFPVSFFATVMGLAGLAISLQRAEKILYLPAGAGHAVTWGAAAVFLLLLGVYSAKVLRFRQEVLKEMAHPIKLSFFPTISISLILLSIAFTGVNHSISFILFAVGSPLHLLFTLFVLSRWIGQSTFEIHHSNPSWFIPVVGNILVPIVGVEHGQTEISWFFFSVGFVFWLVLQTIIFNRIIFHHQLPEKLIPTLFILIAPPAVGFIAYVKMVGSVDNFARLLYYFAFFILMLLVALSRKFYNIKFYLSWWAYSFPIAAISIASILMFNKTGNALFQSISWALLAGLVLIIGILACKTVKAIACGTICVED